MRELDYQRRRNLLILFAAGLLFWSSLSALVPTLPLYAQYVGGTKQQIGLVMGAFAVGLLLSRAWLGPLSDAKGRKLVLLLGALVAGLAPMGYLFVHSIPLMVALRVFHGISLAAFSTAYNTLVADLCPAGRRGEIIGNMSLVNPLGVSLGSAIGGYVQAGMGYSPLFVISSMFAVLALVCCFQVWESGCVELPKTYSTPTVSREGYWQMLWNPCVRIPAVVFLVVGLLLGTLNTFIPLFIQETKVNLNPGLFFTTAAITSFTIRLQTGRASDKYGRGLFITGGLLCYALSMFLIWTANSSQAFLLGAVFQGSGAGTVVPVMLALMADRSPTQERGRLFSLCIGGFDFGLAIAGPLLGYIAEQVGYRNMFAFGMGFACLGLLIFITQSSKNLPASIKFALGQGQDVYALKSQ